MIVRKQSFLFASEYFGFRDAVCFNFPNERLQRVDHMRADVAADQNQHNIVAHV